jgi:hypothetical protein
MVTVPTAGPVDVGESTTLIVQVPANTVNVAPQVPPAAPTGLENGAVTTTLMPATFADPVLCNVRVCAALVVPTITFPNANGPPVTLAIGVLAGNLYSIAPTSIAVPFTSGLALPKKSVVGATPYVGELVGM